MHHPELRAFHRRTLERIASIILTPPEHLEQIKVIPL
jgi:hypothetical protein